MLARVDHVVGYAPYVARVPQREGLTRHASGNSVELDRGRLALDLAPEEGLLGDPDDEVGGVGEWARCAPRRRSGRGWVRR